MKKLSQDIETEAENSGGHGEVFDRSQRRELEVWADRARELEAQLETAERKLAAVRRLAKQLEFLAPGQAYNHGSIILALLGPEEEKKS